MFVCIKHDRFKVQGSTCGSDKISRVHLKKIKMKDDNVEKMKKKNILINVEIPGSLCLAKTIDFLISIKTRITGSTSGTTIMFISQNDDGKETMLLVIVVAATLCKKLISFPIFLTDSASVEVLRSEPLVVESLRGRSFRGRIIKQLVASFTFPRHLSLIRRETCDT